VRSSSFTRDHNNNTTLLVSQHQRSWSGVSSIKSTACVAPYTSAPVFLAHPALEPLHITDELAGCHRASLNSPQQQQLHVMDTDYFFGHMMFLIRTPDVDNDTETVLPFPDNASTVVDYLRGKQRRFEFQGQLKKLPTGRLYFACEMEQSIKLGMLQRAFVSAAMAFVKSSNPYFHYSITGDSATGEPPHMAFPLFADMNRVVATPPGQTPPTLGKAIEESIESQKQRSSKQGRHSQPFEWNLEDTYTFSLWSAYADFLPWKVLNLPGIRPFGLKSVLGLQPIKITVYEMDEDSDIENSSNKLQPHIRTDDGTLVLLELCNADITGLGPAPLVVMTTTTNGENDIPTTVDGDNNSIIPTGEDGDGNSINRNNAVMLEEGAAASDADGEDGDGNSSISRNNNSVILEEGAAAAAADLMISSLNDESDEETPEDQAAAELGEGIYIHSGDPIVLKEASAAPTTTTTTAGDDVIVEENDEETTPGPVCFVTLGGGFCFLARTDVGD
jgi:hypothetical protein